MSTRCMTIVKINGTEAVRFYRHCDGYPQGHGMALANEIVRHRANVTELLFNLRYDIEIQHRGFMPGDVEYVYTLDFGANWSNGGKCESMKIESVASWGPQRTLFEGTPAEFIHERMWGKFATDEL